MYRYWVPAFLFSFFFILPCLGSAEDERVEMLIRDLNHQDYNVRSKAIAKIGWFHDPRGVKPLIILLKDNDKRIRAQAAGALGILNDKQFRVWATKKFGHNEYELAIGPLIDALKDDDSSVRWQAVKALAKIGDKTAVDPLIESLNDDNPRVRERACLSLAQLGDNRAVKPRFEVAQRSEIRTTRLIWFYIIIGEIKLFPLLQ